MTAPDEDADHRDQIVQFLPEMRAFAVSLTRNPTTADDLVQDTIVKAWKSFHQFQSDTNLRAWLFTILRNTYYSDLRRARREVTHFQSAIPETSSRNDTGEGQIAMMDFERAFATLSDEQREVLILVGASGMTYEEAALTCGVAEGTIKSRIARGRQRLAQLMGRS